jgi:hypothetical protein
MNSSRLNLLFFYAFTMISGSPKDSSWTSTPNPGSWLFIPILLFSTQIGVLVAVEMEE